jgi:two-component system response regulator CssR
VEKVWNDRSAISLYTISLYTKRRNSEIVDCGGAYMTTLHSPARIAVLDDDDNIREIVEAYLQKEGYQTKGFSTAESALEYSKIHALDLWVIDIMLPGMSGYDFCKALRRNTEVPIVMISARDEEVDKILGLELGSDDYLTKPFSPRELVARVKRHLKRWETIRTMERDTPATASVSTISQGSLSLSLDERRVFWAGEEIEVTSKEYAIIKLLVERPNRAFSREEILTSVWGNDYFGSDRAVDDLIKRLRRKMDDFPIETVWGYGYRLRTEGGSGK